MLARRPEILIVNRLGYPPLRSLGCCVVFRYAARHPSWDVFIVTRSVVCSGAVALVIYFSRYPFSHGNSSQSWEHRRPASSFLYTWCLHTARPLFPSNLYHKIIQSAALSQRVCRGKIWHLILRSAIFWPKPLSALVIYWANPSEWKSGSFYIEIRALASVSE